MSNKLVAYFSASGVTAKVAENIAKAAETDLFEIKPEVPYTKADIKWTNPMARCNKEKFGKKKVPIASKIEDFGKYDIFFIGFPIWYFAEPIIIDNFLEDYDFTGKKVALFATSGGSDITKVPDKVKPLIAGEIVAAKRFASNDTEETVKEWADSID